MRMLILLAAFTLSAHAQWAIQDAHTTADLRGIDNVGGGVAWASGTNGTVLRTEDAGFVWQLCATPPGAEKLDFRGIQAFDNNTAIVMSSGKGDLSRLYKTSDGCQTWKLVFTNPDVDGFFDSVSFLRINVPNHQLALKFVKGVLLGDPVGGQFAIFQTFDGGDTWIRRLERKKRVSSSDCKIDTFSSLPGESAFAASNEALLDLHPYMFVFVTGGVQSRLMFIDHFDLDFSLCHEYAKAQSLPIGTGTESSGAFAIAADHAMDAIGTRLFIIVGGDYKHPEKSAGTAAIVSTGLSGHGLFSSLRMTASLPNTLPHGYRSAVAYDATAKTWITVGPNGTDVSTDDGRNWRALRPLPGEAPDTDQHWNALSLPFVVGPKGRIGVLETAALKAK
jgi:hypothetical protein